MARQALAVLLLLFLALPAQAGDEEAIAKYNEALEHWNDPDPAVALKAAQVALEEASSKNIQLNVRLLLGRLHSAKTGDSKRALMHYDQIIESVTLLERDQRYWGLKSDALLSKGNVLIAEYDDIPGGLKAFNASYDLKPTSANTNVLSQLLLRLSQEQGKEPTKVRADLMRALNYAKEAVSYEKNAARKRPNVLAKYRVQLALVLEVFARFESEAELKERYQAEAKQTWKAVDQEALDENASYELAQYGAVLGHDAKAVAKHLTAAMEQRPTPRARNILRKWIRDEPFFQGFLGEPTWKTFTNDEPDAS